MDHDVALNLEVFAQVSDQKVWFTEWVENNIGVLDLSKKLPIDVKFDSEEIQNCPTNGQSGSIAVTESAIGDTVT